MSKVYLLLETNSYGESEPVGVFSTRKTAALMSEYRNGVDCGVFGSKIVEFEVDILVREAIDEMNAQIDELEKKLSANDKLLQALLALR